MGTPIPDMVVAFGESPELRVDYSVLETPPGYCCSGCGASHCKLWREYEPLHSQDPDHPLLCIKCLVADQKKSLAEVMGKGRRGVSKQVGIFVLAVPTPDNGRFWERPSLPKAGRIWWEGLPTFPPS